MPITSVTTDIVDRGGLSYGRVDRLSDDELLASTRGLVGKSNQILAALLAHLAEVESRGLHRSKACSSLYTYCVYELRFSEDAASRRVCAVRLVRRFPALLGAVANGELHLTGLLMLGPYITPQNQHELLARAQFRTKKELARLVRILDPLPDVPAQIVALGPAPAPAVAPNARCDWQSFTASLCPVRELAPGDRPGAWATEVSADDEQTRERPEAGVPSGVDPQATALARSAFQGIETSAQARAAWQCFGTAALARTALVCFETTALARVASSCIEKRAASPSVETSAPAWAALQCFGAAALAREMSRECLPWAEIARRETVVSVDSRGALGREALCNMGTAALAREGMDALAVPQRYRVQFTAGEEYVQLFERAKALSSGAAGNGGGVAEIHLRAIRMLVVELEKRRFGVARPAHSAERARTADTGRRSQTAEPTRGRYVPVGERRAVFERDGAQCSYVDARGQRCRETSGLELHHRVPFARDGAHLSTNLALFCRAHNTLAAEEDFGRGFIEAKRERNSHESWADQERT